MKTKSNDARCLSLSLQAEGDRVARVDGTTLARKLEALRRKVLKYVEISEETGKPTGRRASFWGVEFQALQNSDLINQKLEK